MKNQWLKEFKRKEFTAFNAKNVSLLIRSVEPTLSQLNFPAGKIEKKEENGYLHQVYTCMLCSNICKIPILSSWGVKKYKTSSREEGKNACFFQYNNTTGIKSDFFLPKVYHTSNQSRLIFHTLLINQQLIFWTFPNTCFDLIWIYIHFKSTLKKDPFISC